MGIWEELIEKVRKEKVVQYGNSEAVLSALEQGNMAKKVLPNMTKSEAIAALQEAIDTIKGYVSKIKAIRGSNRDPDIQGQISIYGKYITRYLNEVNLYQRITEEEFKKQFPSLTFRDIVYDLPRFKTHCEYFVNRGPRYNPI